jgi:hypothetical protein
VVENASETLEPYFPFGSLVGAVRVRSDGALWFQLMSKEFPFRTHPLLVIEDLPGRGGGDSFGAMGRAFFGSGTGLKAFTRSKLEAETQSHLVRILDAMRRQAVHAFGYRSAICGANCTREKFEKMERLESTLRRSSSARQDVVQIALDLAERLGPDSNESGMTLNEVFRTPLPERVPGLADEADEGASSETAYLSEPPAP